MEVRPCRRRTKYACCIILLRTVRYLPRLRFRNGDAERFGTSPCRVCENACTQSNYAAVQCACGKREIPDARDDCSLSLSLLPAG